MQAANYTSRYAFYRPVYRICSIKPLTPRALTDTGFYYVALATKSYKGLCSRSPVGATASFHGVITRTAFSGIHPPPPPLALALLSSSSSIVVKYKKRKRRRKRKKSRFRSTFVILIGGCMLILGGGGSPRWKSN